MILTNRTSSRRRVEVRKVIRGTLRAIGVEDEEEDADEEEGREVNEHLKIVREVVDEEEAEEDVRRKEEYGGGRSLRNTTSISSILPSPSLTHTTPLSSIRAVSSVFLLTSMVSVRSFTPSVVDESDGELRSVDSSDMSTAPVISITPV